MTPLTPGELADALAALPGWTYHDSSLQRSWRFASFRAAVAFMHDSADEIDRLGHHPEWTNVYDRISVRLNTHEAGHLVTGLDVELAHLLERRAERIV